MGGCQESGTGEAIEIQGGKEVMHRLSTGNPIDAYKICELTIMFA
jgi:hypothetical protein